MGILKKGRLSMGEIVFVAVLLSNPHTAEHQKQIFLQLHHLPDLWMSRGICACASSDRELCKVVQNCFYSPLNP